MDKAEYRIKLDQINELADAGDYKGALEVVDSVDWRRVKSVRTLCMVGEIYEVNGRLEDSRKVLEVAYRRSSISKTVLYRLAELCIKSGDFDAGLDYYTEFAEVSPMDNSKYILKYKLYRARKSPLEDQIAILEEYKEREYTERWAYELAKLYNQAGMKDKCVETCDDLILWFSEGKYVTKAMELKMQYTPLSPSQNEQYQANIKQILSPKPAAPAPQETSEEEDLDEEDMDEEELEKRAIIRTEQAIEKMDAAASSTVQEEPVLKIPPVAVPPVSGVKPADPVKMQSQLASSIRAVFSGLNKETKVEAPKAANITEDDVKVYEPEKDDISNLEVKELEPEQFGAEQAHVQAVTNAVVGGESRGETTEEQIEGQMTLADFAAGDSELDLDALFAETSSTLAQEVATGEFIKTDASLEEKQAEEARRQEEAEAARKAEEERQAAEAAEAARAEAARQAAEAETARKAEEARQAAEAEAARKAEEERRAAEEAARKAEAERKAAEEALRYARETDESLGLTREFNFQSELKKAMETGQVESEAVAQIIGQDTPAEDAGAPEPEAEIPKAEEPVAELPKPEAPEAEIPEIPAAVIPAAAAAGAVQEMAADTEQDATVKIQEETAQTPQTLAEPDMSPQFKEAARKQQEETDLPVNIQLEDDVKRLKYVPVEPRAFDETEKKVFSYFSTIPGISQQVTQTIADVHNNAGDKTSRSGNILLVGRQGSGKTKLCDSIILAICKDLDIEAAKVAKVIARDFNQKDPAAVVAKLSGGFLIVEGAGELDRETAAKLSQAMEFRTDSMVVMLEDEKADLKAMLDQNPELAEKFTSTVMVPVFTNDELVTFAKTYANECGYRMDEMGVLALYTMIGDNQKDAEPITVARVKEMVDTAIERANKGTRKFGRKLSKKAMDEDNRVILYEKDFDFE